ncbi:hypothetical protein Tco_0582544 [Tanacetum coccineum]
MTTFHEQAKDIIIINGSYSIAATLHPPFDPNLLKSQTICYIEDNQLNEAYLVVVPVVDDENLLVDSEIQVMDDVLVDPNAEEYCVAPPDVIDYTGAFFIGGHHH